MKVNQFRNRLHFMLKNLILMRGSVLARASPAKQSQSKSYQEINTAPRKSVQGSVISQGSSELIATGHQREMRIDT